MRLCNLTADRPASVNSVGKNSQIALFVRLQNTGTFLADHADEDGERVDWNETRVLPVETECRK